MKYLFKPKSIRHFAYSFLASALALCFVVQCSSGKKVTDVTPPDGGGPPNTHRGELRPTPPEGGGPCEEFFYYTNYAVSLHARRQSNEMGSLLAKAYKESMRNIANEPTNDDRVRDIARKFEAGMGDSITSCEPYQKLAEELKPKDASEDALLRHLQNALVYYVGSLDPFSRYSPPKLAAKVERGFLLANQRCGAGLVLRNRTDYEYGRKPSYLIVDGVLDESENRELVEKGPLPIGSQISAIMVEGKPKAVKELSADDAFKLLNDRPSEDCPEGDHKQLDVLVGDKQITLALETFNPVPAHVKVLSTGPNGSVILIKLDHFDEDLDVDLLRAILGKIKGLNLAGMILDLRGNGGGRGDQSVSIAETFLRKPKSIVSSYVEVPEPDSSVPYGFKVLSFEGKSRWASVDRTHIPQAEVLNVPLVTLVDRGTASASELAVGALRDHQRTLIVGERTFGKGIGQAVFSVSKPLGGVMRVTNDYDFPPSGESYQGVGITPHIDINEDPSIAFAQSKSKELNRMSDFIAANPESAVPKPTNLAQGVATFQPPSDPEVSLALIEKLKASPKPTFPECAPITNESEIREESDCILKVGVEYLNRLIEEKKKGS